MSELEKLVDTTQSAIPQSVDGQAQEKSHAAECLLDTVSSPSLPTALQENQQVQIESARNDEASFCTQECQVTSKKTLVGMAMRRCPEGILRHGIFPVLAHLRIVEWLTE